MIELPVSTGAFSLPRRLADPRLLVPEPDGAVRCLACSHRCLVRPGRAGACHVRAAAGDGQLLVPWGHVALATCEPIEKKPFFHVLPGQKALTFGMLGCNYHCAYCVNWQVSQVGRDAQADSPPLPCSAGDLAGLALREGAAALVASYNEPLIAAEWLAEVFTHGHDAGLLCGIVSNGSATPEVLDLLRPCVDFIKVDLKAFRERAYRSLGGVLGDVLTALELIRQRGFWLEVVTVVVPGFNDSDAELRDLARFLAGLGREIPWHLAPFHPEYRMSEAQGYLRSTPHETMMRAYDTGKEAGLQHVYISGLPGGVGARESTHCAGCGAVVLERRGYRVLRSGLRDGNDCERCGERLVGVFLSEPFHRLLAPRVE